MSWIDHGEWVEPETWREFKDACGILLDLDENANEEPLPVKRVDDAMVQGEER